MRIGVLALQGAFHEHMEKLKELKIEALEVRESKDLKELDGLILPGGESTTMGKLLVDFNLSKGLLQEIEKGLPVWGTCAGMIVLAKKIEDTEITHIPVMDIEVVRNGYGRQLGSFESQTEMLEIQGAVPMVFIRAPYIKSAGKKVKILAEIDGRIVAARQGNMLATAFHPELTKDNRVHELFIKIVKNRNIEF